MDINRFALNETKEHLVPVRFVAYCRWRTMNDLEKKRINNVYGQFGLDSMQCTSTYSLHIMKVYLFCICSAKYKIFVLTMASKAIHHFHFHFRTNKSSLILFRSVIFGWLKPSKRERKCGQSVNARLFIKQVRSQPKRKQNRKIKTKQPQQLCMLTV